MRFKNFFAISLILMTTVLFIYFTSNKIFGPPSFDVIIKNGLIVDGLGGKPYRADIGIYKGKITQIGSLSPKGALKLIDASGLMVCPGFIDLLTCADKGILTHPGAYNFIRQGVTTVVGGSWGNSPYPIGDFLKKVQKTKIPFNFCTLVGYNTIRDKVMGNRDRIPGEDDIKGMERLVAQSLAEGALGLAIDLKCIPGAYARAPELIELAKWVRLHGGFYAVHLRNGGPGILESLREIIDIARTAHLPVHICHPQIMGVDKGGGSTEILALLENARNAGIDISLDQDLYSAAIPPELTPNPVIEGILEYPATIIASDGELVTFTEGKPHPGFYGTFPRILKTYVREKEILRFEEAIRKMTSLPAKLLGLQERGCIARGFYADITMVDPVSVSDTAARQNPHQFPQGIPYVLVNGEPVVENNEFLGFYPGMVIYRKAHDSIE